MVNNSEETDRKVARYRDVLQEAKKSWLTGQRFRQRVQVSITEPQVFE
jgi:hypothetical protein